MQAKAASVDSYIKQAPPQMQPVLTKLRSTIRNAAPKATEKISYGMPFYEYGGTGYKGRLIYFALFRQHIGVFIPPKYAQVLPKEMKRFHVTQATYRFPLGKPLPYALLARAVKNLVKACDNAQK